MKDFVGAKIYIYAIYIYAMYIYLQTHLSHVNKKQFINWIVYVKVK